MENLCVLPTPSAFHYEEQGSLDLYPKKYEQVCLGWEGLTFVINNEFDYAYAV